MATSTTIKVQRTTKAQLNRHRYGTETYDATIRRLLQHMPKQTLKERLIEGARANAARDRRITKEWEASDAPWPPE